MQLNDAVVLSQDVREDTASQQITEFLGLVDLFYEIVNEADRRIGGCGARGVVCEGSRFNLRGNLGWLGNSQPKERPSYFCPRPIMMNTAFARAYGVETSKQLSNSRTLYVEATILRNSRPAVMDYWTTNQLIRVDPYGEFFLVRK